MCVLTLPLNTNFVPKMGVAGDREMNTYKSVIVPIHGRVHHVCKHHSSKKSLLQQMNSIASIACGDPARSRRNGRNQIPTPWSQATTAYYSCSFITNDCPVSTGSILIH